MREFINDIQVTGEVYACEQCKDRGYVRPNVPYGHPNFGKAITCECLRKKQKMRRQNDLLLASGILDMAHYRDATFQTFNGHLGGVQQAYQSAVAYAGNPTGWFVLTGPYGCGKTHLATAIARSRIEAGDTVLMQTVPDLLDHLRAAFRPSDAESYDERFEKARTVDLLVLDDYGAQNDTQWATEKLFQLLNYRYNDRLTTIITSNCLDQIDSRVYSRLRDAKLVQWITMDQARDYRIHGCDDTEEL